MVVRNSLGLAPTVQIPDIAFLRSSSAMGTRLRAHPWETTPLGAPVCWPQALRTVLGIVLDARWPSCVCWGPEQICIYNDSFAALIGDRNSMPGRSLSEIWPSKWPEPRVITERVLNGETCNFDKLTLAMADRAASQWDLSCGPIYDDVSGVGGILFNFNKSTVEPSTVASATSHLDWFFHHAPGFTCILTGPEFVIEFANSGTRKLYRQHNVIGRSIRDASPNFSRGLIETLERVYCSGETEVAHCGPYFFPDGPGDPVSPHMIDFIYKPIFVAGEVAGIFVHGVDVTERDRAAEALRNSEAQFAAIIQLVPVPVALAEAPTGRLVFRNARFNSLFGLEEGWTEGFSNYSNLVGFHADGRPYQPEEWPIARAIMRGELIEGEEIDLVDAHGGRRTTSVNVSPIRDAAGRVTAAIVSSSDVTESKRLQAGLEQRNVTLEARVAERSAELDRLWQLSSDLMLTYDMKYIITSANPACTATLGWTQEELIGTCASDLGHPEDVANARRLGLRPLPDAAPLRFETRVRQKSGNYRWLSGMVVIDTSKGMIHAVLRDVTAEREAQEALLAAEEQLRQAQKMEALGQLTSGIAHDFNNLLTPVCGGLELAERSISDEKVLRHLRLAARAAERGASLTQQLLAFARKQHLAPLPTDLNHLVLVTEDMLSRTIGPHIKIRHVLAEDLWLALVDSNQLEVALLNVALNARDAMPSGGVLGIETRNAPAGSADSPVEVAGSDCVVVMVSDTGTGMSEAVLARAFDPFFTTKEAGKGSGLGLSMVFGVARQSGGTVKLRSEMGKGTTIEIYLPRVPSLEGTAEPHGLLSDAKIVGDAAATDRRCRILVVDDDPHVLELTANCLAELGHTTVEAKSGSEALAYLEQGKPCDMLLLDLTMPGMSGPETFRLARRIRPEIRVLFATGYADASSYGEPVRDATLIKKPFRLDSLAAAISQALKG